MTGQFCSTQVETVLAESLLTPILTRFQTIFLQEADEWAHLPPADDRRQILFTVCRQRLNRKDWRNTQLFRLNQLDQILRFDRVDSVISFPSPMEQVSPIPTIITPPPLCYQQTRVSVLTLIQHVPLVRNSLTNPNSPWSARHVTFFTLNVLPRHIQRLINYDKAEWRCTTASNPTPLIRSSVQTNVIHQPRIPQWNTDIHPTNVTVLLVFLKK